MSKWQKIVKILPTCIAFFIFVGLIACYVAFITIYDTQNDGRLFVFNGPFSRSNPSRPEPKSNHWWINRYKYHVKITKESNGSIPIIFYGDSITEGWSSNGHLIFQYKYAPHGVVNYGISADRVEHVLWRMKNGEIDGLSPKLIVLMIGTNNLGQKHQTNEDIANGIITIIEHLQLYLPVTKILLLGILPRRGAEAMKRIIIINKMIESLHDESSVYYLNMFNNFTSTTDPGAIDNELFNDGLHLTTAGYQVWSDVMDPLFTQLSSD